MAHQCQAMPYDDEPLRAHVDGSEALYHRIKQVAGSELLYKALELEVLENLPDILAERLYIAHQVVSGLGIEERAQGERRGPSRDESSRDDLLPVARRGR